MTTENLMQIALNDMPEATQNVAHAAHEYAHFYDNPVFWVAISFLLVILLLGKPVYKFSRQMLQKRVDTILKRINDAANLKDDAQKLLVEYERKFISAEAEANQIFEKSNREIELMKKESLAKLKRDMEIKENEVNDRLKAAQDEMLSDVLEMTSDVTLQALKQVFREKFNSEIHNSLIEKSINDISKMDKVN